MTEAGWRARASGWFTRTVADGYTAVAVVGTASEHAQPDEADAFWYVGLRDEWVEHRVAELSEVADPGGYRLRTAIRPLRIASPWTVSAQVVDKVAADMTGILTQEGLPYLTDLAKDPEALIAAASSHVGREPAPGQCRVAVLIAHYRSRAQAVDFIDQAVASVVHQDNPWAVQVRATMGRVRAWVLESRDSTVSD
jgi:hypothetical protein